MAIKDALVAEFKNESANTLKMMQRVPDDKFGWMPHEKSMTLGRLASHIADIPLWVKRVMEADEFDFAKNLPTRTTYADGTGLLKAFDEKQAGAIELLNNASDEMLHARFTLRRGDKIYFEVPRKVMLRNFVLNHTIHHRGQLSVYLRLLGIPVPGMYGPSADESM